MLQQRYIVILSAPLGTYTIDVFSDGSDIVLCRFSASLDGTVSGGI